MDKENKNIIKETAAELLEMIGFDCEVEITETDNNNDNVVCEIVAKKEANFIIGQNGDNLQALQHIARLLVRKKTDNIIRFILDVNSYKKDQENSVIELAKEMAKKATSEKRVIVMRPMSAYNRRLVHMILEDNNDVVTESTGDEGDRRVVIKPVSL